MPTLRTIREWLARAGLLETAALVSVLVSIGCVWVFAEVADEVLDGDSRQLDEHILLALREPGDPAVPRGPRWLIATAQDLTALGGVSVITIVCVAVLGFLAMQKRWGAFWLVLASVIGGAVGSVLLKEWFNRGRPSVVPHLAEVTSFSFPSGHSLISAVTYLTLGVLLARTTADWHLKAYFLGFALGIVALIGMTRVYLGVHYPTDVLAGWCAGIAWALLCNFVAQRLQRAGAVECEAPSSSRD